MIKNTLCEPIYLVLFIIGIFGTILSVVGLLNISITLSLIMCSASLSGLIYLSFIVPNRNNKQNMNEIQTDTHSIKKKENK